MAEHIDHVAAAKSWIENSVKAQASTQQNNEQLATAYASVGQVHATLALVEQQRIANLVAIAVSDKTGRVTAEQFASEAIHLLKGERRGD